MVCSRVKTLFAKLGDGRIWAEKPVVLFDDYRASYQEFDTVEEAFSARQLQVNHLDKWAAFKLVFRLNAATATYELTA
jgi:hypothetical protein